MDRSTRLSLPIFALFALASLLWASHPAQAQNDPGSVHVGLRGGIAQSSFNVDQGDASSTSGFTGGLQVGYAINRALSVQFGFLYSEKGAEDITAEGGPNRSDAFDLDGDNLSTTYLDFPVLFKLTAPVDAVKISAMAGPSISFVTDATQNGNDQIRSVESNIPVTNRILLYDLAGIIGGEIALPVPGLSNIEAAIDGRYAFGFTNIEQTQGFDFQSRDLNGSLILRVGL